MSTFGNTEAFRGSMSGEQHQGLSSKTVETTNALRQIAAETNDRKALEVRTQPDASESTAPSTADQNTSAVSGEQKGMPANREPAARSREILSSMRELANSADTIRNIQNNNDMRTLMNMAIGPDVHQIPGLDQLPVVSQSLETAIVSLRVAEQTGGEEGAKAAQISAAKVIESLRTLQRIFEGLTRTQYGNAARNLEQQTVATITQFELAQRGARS
ncbi:hypothetical protein IPM44_03060 [bacterium]|nr:MAG: hypothetical protein IPM44_03060 [bacterium]